MMRIVEALASFCAVAIALFLVSVTVVEITRNNQEASMTSEQDFTVRAYDLGNKPIEASGKHRVRLYSGGRVIKDMLTDITPVISPEGFVFVNGIRVSGTVIVEEVNQ